MGMDDIQYLVDHIWDGRSCLSQESDLYHLQLARWNASLPWAPWNCILLTREEAEAHAQLADPAAVYQAALAGLITRKHVQAQQKFAALYGRFARA